MLGGEGRCGEVFRGAWRHEEVLGGEGRCREKAGKPQSPGAGAVPAAGRLARRSGLREQPELR